MTLCRSYSGCVLWVHLESFLHFIVTLMFKFRRLIVCWILGSLLLTQLAMAAYVCPAQFADPGVSQVVMAQMDECEGMDTMQPALCQAMVHDAAEQRNVDYAASIEIPPFAVSGLVQVSAVDQVSPYFYSLARNNSSSLVGLSPPLSILHCCFLV